MAVQGAELPPSGLALLKRDSIPPALIAAGVGAASVVVVLVGTLLILTFHGYTPVETLVSGFRSHELDAVLLVGVALGFAAAIMGFGIFRKMPTKVSREEAISGAVMGIQAAVLGIFLFWFENGDRVEVFARNYLNFEEIAPFMDTFLNAVKNTLVLAFASEFFGIILGLTLAMFAISKRKVVRAPARVYVNFFRGTPLIWQLIFIGIAIPIGLGIRIDTYTAGITALSLNAGAYMAEVFRAGIQSIERGQLEAARGLGMTYMQAMRHAILPQAIRRVIPPLMNEFVILIKDTALIIILGLSAVQRDLMNWGDQAVANEFNPSPYIMTAVGYLAITLPMIRFVNYLEKRLRSGLVGIGA